MKKNLTILFLMFFVFSFSFGQNEKMLRKKKEQTQKLTTKNLSVLNQQTNYKPVYMTENKGSKNSLSEDFEGTFPPDGWTCDQGGAEWDSISGIPDHTLETDEGHYARYNCYDINQSVEGWLVTAKLSPTAGDVTFSYWVNYYQVTSGGHTAELYVDVYDVALTTWINGTTNVISGQGDLGWYQENIDLSNYEGQDFTNKVINVRFRAISDWGYYNIAIDDVAGPELWVSPNDAGITSIDEPAGTFTAGSRDVKVTLKNFGLVDLDSVNIEWEVNGIAQTTYTWKGPALTTGQTKQVTLDSYDFSAGGDFNIKANTTMPNGIEDGNNDNDTASVDIFGIRPGQLSEDFEGPVFPHEGWDTISGGDPNGWELFSKNHTLGGAQCAGIKFGDTAHDDWLISPQLSISASDTTYKFWGKNYSFDYSDQFNVFVSTTGTNQTDFNDTIASNEKPGTSWEQFSYNLSDYIGQNIYVAIQAISKHKNFLYIDDVVGPAKTDISNNDLAVESIIYPTDYVFEGDTVTVKAVVKNVGLNSQTAKQFELDVNGVSTGLTDNIGTILYNEIDTLVFNWTSTGNGVMPFKVYQTVADDNPDNDTLSNDNLVLPVGMSTYDFEVNDTLWDFSDNWEIVDGLPPTPDEYAPYHGDYSAICSATSPYANKKLVTPRYILDGTYQKFYFYGKRVNGNMQDDTTSIQMMYSSDGVNWTNLGDVDTLTFAWKLYTVDISEIPDSIYYFAYSATTTFNDEYNGHGYAMIDHVTGPEVLFTDASLSDLTVDGTTVTGFNPDTLAYTVELPYGTSVVPTVVGTPTDANANVVVTPATALPGTTTIDVTAEDGSTTLQYTVAFTVLPNTETDITAYSFAEQTDPATINETEHTVNIEVAYGTNVTALVATFTLSVGATADIDNIAQVSGTTSNDFTSPVTYTITAQDEITTQDWVVTVTRAPNTETDITAYSFAEQTDPATINETEHTVNIEVAYGTDVTALTPTITVSAGAQVSPTSGTEQDFTNPVVYTVTAEDETTTQDWVVTVTRAPNTDASLSDLTVDGTTVTGFVPGTLAYTVELPYGTSVVPTVVGTPTDANANVIVTSATAVPGTTTIDVTAEDGSTTLQYTVAFTVLSPNTETDITAYSFTEQTGAATIDATAHTVNIEVAYGTDVTALVATFTLSVGATADIGMVAQESNVTSNDFTSPVTYTITAEDGTTIQDWVVTVSVATSVEDIAINGLNIYPNPSTGIFFIKSDEVLNNTQLFIRDITGRLILSKKLNSNKNTVNISSSPAGIYFIQMITNNKIINYKILLK